MMYDEEAELNAVYCDICGYHHTNPNVGDCMGGDDE